MSCLYYKAKFIIQNLILVYKNIINLIQILVISL